MDLGGILKKYWGFSGLRPLQREAMECVCAGRDSLVVLPTGGGKSLCFQAPALTLDGPAVVVSPLISLMKDQVDALNGAGVYAAFLNSSLAATEQRAVCRALSAGKVKILYVAPERLLTEGFLSPAISSHVSYAPWKGRKMEPLQGPSLLKISHEVRLIDKNNFNADLKQYIFTFL